MKAKMLATKYKSFIAIAKNLCEDNPSKEYITLARAMERRSRDWAQHGIESKRDKMEFVNIKIIIIVQKGAKEFGIIFEDYFKAKMVEFLAL